MENYISDAFVTGLTMPGRYVTSAFQSEPELRKDPKENNAKIDDDILVLESKINKLSKNIDMNSYVTEKALENLALQKDSFRIDLHQMRQKMCGDHSGKCNYMRMLIQILGKVNSLTKEIKKINKFKHTNLNKRFISTSSDNRRVNKSPSVGERKTSPFRSGHSYVEKRKQDMEGIVSKYEKALKAELEYRLRSINLNSDDEKVKEHVRQFTLKKIKKVKTLNKKVEEICNSQKQKQAAMYVDLMAKRKTPQERQILSANTHTLNRNHNDYRSTVQRNRQLLQEKLYRKLDNLMTKHQTKCMLLACAAPIKQNVPSTDKKREDALMRKKAIENQQFSLKLQKLVEKQQRIKEINSGSIQSIKRSSKEECTNNSQIQSLCQIKQSSNSDSLRVPQAKATLLESILESQSKVQFRKQQMLRQMSDDIRQNLDERFQRQMKKQQENCLLFNERIEEVQNKMIQTKKKLELTEMKNEKFKETVIHDKFKLAVNKIRCEEQIGKLSELPLGQLQKKLSMGRQAALKDVLF